MIQYEIMDEILGLARQIEPLQRRINELAIMDTKLPNNQRDKDMSESIESWRTYNN